MARLLKFETSTIEEGMLFNRWLYNRLIAKNKNVLGVETGGTGSGKSYRDLRKAELWYRYYFDEEFPIENICFSVAEVMKRLSSGELRKGEVLVFEEAGANLGSLDFQNKISKLFTYVLQSFRSMNIAIFFNLPYTSMLNKSARMLLHYNSESMGIDYKTGRNKCKFFFIQVNQKTGKIYTKYLRARINGKMKTIQRIAYSMPSDELKQAYEQKKLKFLSDMTKEFSDKLEEIEKDKLKKMARPGMTEKQAEVYEMLLNGMTRQEVADKLNIHITAVQKRIKSFTNRGYKEPKIPKNSKEE